MLCSPLRNRNGRKADGVFGRHSEANRASGRDMRQHVRHFRIFFVTCTLIRQLMSPVRLLAPAVAVLWLFAAPAQACFNRGVDDRVEDLPVSVTRDVGSFALVRLSHATYPSDAGNDQSEMLMYRIINGMCVCHSARLLFEGPAFGRTLVEYISVPADLAPGFVRELQSTIQATITDRYSDDLWRLYQVSVDIIDTTDLAFRIEFREPKWFRSQETALPDVTLSIWDVFDPGRTQSLRAPFGCTAKALAEELQGASFGFQRP